VKVGAYDEEEPLLSSGNPSLKTWTLAFTGWLAGWLEDVPPDYSEIRLCLCVTNLVMKDDNWSKGTPAKLSTLSLSLCLSIYFRLIILGTAFDES
jgi:hypothetical protein